MLQGGSFMRPLLDRPAVGRAEKSFHWLFAAATKHKKPDTCMIIEGKKTSLATVDVRPSSTHQS